MAHPPWCLAPLLGIVSLLAASASADAGGWALSGARTSCAKRCEGLGLECDAAAQASLTTNRLVAAAVEEASGGEERCEKFTKKANKGGLPRMWRNKKGVAMCQRIKPGAATSCSARKKRVQLICYCSEPASPPPPPSPSPPPPSPSPPPPADDGPACRAVGAECFLNTQCCNRICSLGLCDEKRPDGFPCDFDVQCESGRCADGTCVPVGGGPPPGAPCGLAVAVFNNVDLEGEPMYTGTDEAVSFTADEANGNSYGFSTGLHGSDADRFSARWAGWVVPSASGEHTFFVNSDDGARLSVGCTPLIDEWRDMGRTEHAGSMELAAGAAYAIELEFYENAGGTSDHEGTSALPHCSLD